MRKRTMATAFAMIPMLVSNANADTTKIGVISSTYLNIRYSPSTSGKLQLVLKKNDKVSIIGEKNGWYKIKTNSGKIGWAISKYIKVENNKKMLRTSIKKVVIADVLNIRSGPNTTYSSIGKLYKNNKVEVISESNGWSKIKFGSKIGYVSSEYLKELNNENQNLPQSTKKTIQEVTSSILNVRNGAGGKYTKIDTLHKGDLVTVHSVDNNWAKIEYNGKNGYVSAIYLKYISDNIEEDENINNENSNLIPGAYIQRTKREYSLDDMLNVQDIKSQNGGNLITRRKNNIFENEYTSLLYRTNPRAYDKPTRDEIKYYIDPVNFTSHKDGIMQFTRLDKYTNSISAKSLNNYFASKGDDCIFNGKGQTFIDVAKRYNIDVIYFVSHAMWETGNGKSNLAKGQLVTVVDGIKLEEPVIVYNFFGIGATDGNALEGGKVTAYKNGWTSIEKGIDGAAKWISKTYIHNSKYNQNTVYNMRWSYDYSWHQYATDVNWANGISKMMSSLLTRYGDGKDLLIDIPEYK